MHVVPYEKEKHLPIVNGWKIARGKPAFPDFWLPKTGFMVFDGENAIIAAFLYVTDSGLAFLENVISDENSTREQRQKGLDLIGEATEAEAKARGIRAVQGQTSVKTVADAASRNGWRTSDFKYSILVKVIE